MKNTVKLIVSLSVGIFFTYQHSYAQQIQTDFDGDGYSEFTIVSIESDKSLTWKTSSGISGLTAGLQSFGVSGNHIIMAPWKGTTQPQIGVVSLDDTGKKLAWKVVGSSGVVEERVLGGKTSTIISGGDFDGNGVADAAVAKLGRSGVKWSIAYDLFSQPVGLERIANVNFGKSGDRIFFASPDGTSDWIGTVGKAANGRDTELKIKSLLTGEVRTSDKALPRFIVKNPRPRPFPVKAALGFDVIGFTRVVGGNTKVYFYTLDGGPVTVIDLPGKGDIVVGNFNDGPGEEIAIKTTGGFTVVNPFTLSSSTAASSDGVAVDQININTLSADTTNSTPNNSGGGGDDDQDSGGGPSSIAACQSVVGWPGSHIYKTRGSDHFTDIRRNTIGVVIKPGGRGPFPGCISMVDRKGRVVAKLGLYSKGSGWAARYYAGIGCGASTAYGGSRVASLAQSNTGSSEVYANFGSVCFGPVDASRCVNSSSC